jgi:hypothetical protein
MKKIITLLILVCALLKLSSQEILFETQIDLDWSFQDKRESYPALDLETGNLALFILDNSSIKAQLFDRNYKLMNELKVDRPRGPYKTLLGSSYREIKYNLFFTNEARDAFCIKTIDLGKSNYSETILPLSLKDEKLLETICHRNQFYMLTVKKKSSIIKIYIFDSDAQCQIKELDFSGHAFSGSKYSKLSDVLHESVSPFILSSNVYRIDNNSPSTLDLASKENKIYTRDDQFILTIDNDLSETKILTIDLKDYRGSVRTYRQVKSACEDPFYTKSNSYLYENYLFQIKGCNEEMQFSIIDILTDSLIKGEKVTKEEEITFRNSPLFQEGGVTVFVQDKKKELETTKQILKKIADSNIGIAVYKISDTLELTLGGYLEVKQNSFGGPMISTPGTTISTPSGTVYMPGYSYNPTMNGYNSYKNKRSIYFKSLLNIADFEHLSGEAKRNAFDKIKDFNDFLGSNISSETVFRVEDYYVLGYYNALDKKYLLLKFTD